MEIENRARDVEIDELTKSLEFAYSHIREQKSWIDDLKMKYKNVNLRLNKLTTDFDNLDEAVAEDHERIIYLDDYGRRSSIRIRGIP